jgi:enolase
MSDIQYVHARQILDSRGTPTIEVDVCLSDGNEVFRQGRRKGRYKRQREDRPDADCG